MLEVKQSGGSGSESKKNWYERHNKCLEGEKNLRKCGWKKRSQNWKSKIGASVL